MKNQIARNPITAYFILAFAGTWLLVLPLVFSQNGLGWYHLSAPEGVFALPFWLGTFTGPLLAAVLVTWAQEGRAGLTRFFQRFVQWRVGWTWYALVVLGYPLLYLLATSLWFAATPWQNLQQHWPTFFTNYLPSILIFPAFITWGEEPGWRGFALTCLQPIYGPLKASLMVGLLHAFWHLPLYLMLKGPVAIGPMNFWTFVVNTLSIIAVSVLWTWVFNNANGSIFIAVLLHASSNAAPNLVLPGLPKLPPQAALIMLGVYVGLALLVYLGSRARLGYKNISAVANPSFSGVVKPSN